MLLLAPILDDIHIPLGTVRRNGSLLPNHPASVFRQDPSHEVDMAWHRLSNINPIPITAQDVRNIGYNPDEVAKWPAEYGLGDDAYGELPAAQFQTGQCKNLLLNLS